MFSKKYFSALLFTSLITLSQFCFGQSHSLIPDDAKLVGNPCEGCEAIFEYGSKPLSPVDTLPRFLQSKTKLKVSGIILNPDGKTPASDVIVYIYQTNEHGVYETKGDETGWARRHGFIRGWVKTTVDGQFSFYTIKPGVYPNRSEPAHIHFTILEPNGKYYWISNINFRGDPLLSDKELHPNYPRGGGPIVLEVTQNKGLLEVYKTIVIGKNIPGYE